MSVDDTGVSCRWTLCLPTCAVPLYGLRVFGGRVDPIRSCFFIVSFTFIPITLYKFYFYTNKLNHI